MKAPQSPAHALTAAMATAQPAARARPTTPLAPPRSDGHRLVGAATSVQRSEMGGEQFWQKGSPGDVHQVAADGVSGPGSRLPHLDRVQAAFGDHDLGAVRAHHGPRAQRAALGIGAGAYTRGDHIAFARPNPSVGEVAHEAAHVVHQRRGVQLSSGLGETGDAYERHADEVARRVETGSDASDLLGAAPSSEGSRVQRSEDDADRHHDADDEQDDERGRAM